MKAEVIRRLSRPTPRYTSYPTPPNFKPTVIAREFREALRGLDPASSLSLYLHIPFCSQLCWYCGCNTRAARHRGPIDDYLAALTREIEEVARLTAGRRVTAVH